MANNRVKFGLKNVHYALINEAGNAFSTPMKPAKGAVNMTLSKKGDTTEFYADDILYYVSDNNAGYDGELEISVAETEMLHDLLGWTIDDNGAIIECANDTSKQFAMCFEVASNKKAQRFVFYNCTLSRPDVKASTKTSSSNPQTDTLKLTVAPIEMAFGETDVKAVVKAMIELSSTNSTAYNGFFGAVYMPVMKPAGATSGASGVTGTIYTGPVGATGSSGQGA